MVLKTVCVALIAVGLNTVVVGAASAASGDLDQTFGDDGVVRTDFRGRDAAAAVAIQSDGKIVVAGKDGRRFVLARYTPGGALDTTFGGDGKVATNLTAGDDFASDLAIQADGKIVVTGRAGGNGGRFATARYGADGALDGAFGGDGVVLTNFSPSDDFASGVAIQADGDIVVVGRARGGSYGGPSDAAFALVRYLSDGSRDPAFSSDGKVFANLTPGGDFALDAAVQPDQRIVVAGRGGGSRGRFAVARFTADGVRDASFGGDGTVFTNFSRYQDSATSLALQADGKIVVAGSATRITYGATFALARYEVDGSLDVSFSGDGKAVTRFAEYFVGGWYDIANDIAIQADGKIVVAGSSHRSVLLGMCCDRFTAIARFTPEGVLDDLFSGDGKVVDDIGPSHGANGVAIQADGKIVTAGEAFVDLHSTFVVLRYLAA